MSRRRYKNRCRSMVTDCLKWRADMEINASETLLRIFVAIDDTFLDYRKTEQGKRICEVIELLYVKQTHSTVGVALKLNASERTIRRWKNQFLDDVCIRAKLIKY